MSRPLPLDSVFIGDIEFLVPRHAATPTRRPSSPPSVRAAAADEPALPQGAET